MPSATKVLPGYRAITMMVREQDAAEVKRIADTLKSEGWTHANVSFVLRAAMVILSDLTRGKSGDELLHFFVDYRAKRLQQRPVTQGGAGSGNKA